MEGLFHSRYNETTEEFVLEQLGIQRDMLSFIGRLRDNARALENLRIEGIAQLTTSPRPIDDLATRLVITAYAPGEILAGQKLFDYLEKALGRKPDWPQQLEYNPQKIELGYCLPKVRYGEIPRIQLEIYGPKSKPSKGIK